MGRVLLAGLGEEELISLYRSESKTGGSFSLAPVLAQWKTDRKKETIAHIGDFEADIASVAAPLRGADGKIAAAISLTSPSARSKAGELQATISGAILRAAAQISAQLGYQAGRTGPAVRR